MLLTSLERLKSNPAGELARIAAHIGHGHGVTWHEDLAAENVSAARARRLPLHGLLIANPVAAALRRTLVPKSIRTRIRNSRKMAMRPEIPADRIAGLKALFAADRDVLAKHFPDDPSLDLAYPWHTP